MLEIFHLTMGNQDPGDPGVGKVRGGKGFFFLQAGGGDWPWMTLWQPTAIVKKPQYNMYSCSKFIGK